MSDMVSDVGDRTLPNRVMALAITVALLLIAGCGGLLYYASVAVNGITLARETRLMERSVERKLARLKDDVASVVVWNDAYDLTVVRFDRAWAQVNYGTYFSQYLHHDLSLIVDDADRPIYAFRGGAALAPQALGDFARAAQPLIAKVRRQSAAKIARRPTALGFDRVGAAEAAVRVGPKVYLVSASTVVPEPSYTKPLLPGPGPVVLSALEVSPAYLRNLRADYGLRDARLAEGPAGDGPAIPLRDARGQAVAAIGWSPEEPGLGVYWRARWPILILGAAVLGAVVLVILRLRLVARELAAARDRAQTGERTKSEFIANMSHEIRTPLNGMLGMAQAMEGYELSSDQRGRLAVIRESGEILLGVLNDVLDLAKIDAGKLQVEETVFTLDQLARQVRAAFSEAAAAKRLAFDVEVKSSEIPAWRGDALRIRQVLSNLVSNALKFTSTGSVVLAIAPTAEGVEFRITDTGIGIGAAQMPSLFEKFAQGDASMTRRYGGTGLGLAITRQLVDLMGGSIQVASRPGEGSVFTVVLPLRPVAEAPAGEGAAAAPAPAPAFLRILAAEDSPTNQRVLRALLGPLGADITLVVNGREAVAAVARAGFDLILMDIQMPEMNGLEAAAAIRELEAVQGRPRTPILAVTANVMSHQVASYLAVGMDGYVAKPIDAAELYAAVRAAAPVKPGAAAA